MTYVDKVQAALDRAAANPPVPSAVVRSSVRTAPAGGTAMPHPGRARWAWLHATLAQPIAGEDRPAIEAAVLKLGDGMGCGCGNKWKRLIAAKPIDWNAPEQWAIDRHNDVNRTLGKRHDWTVEEARDARAAT